MYTSTIQCRMQNTPVDQLTNEVVTCNFCCVMCSVSVRQVGRKLIEKKIGNGDVELELELPSSQAMPHV